MSPIIEAGILEVLKVLSERRVNGKVASGATMKRDREVVLAAFRRLHAGGYKIEKPENVGQKHIAWLVRSWYEQGKAPKTMQNELSRLRVFFRKLGKGNMVGSVEDYLPDVDPKELKVKAAAERSKSWVMNEVDVIEAFKVVDREDWRLGLMLRLQLATGLRREEVLKCNPHIQDHGTWFAVLENQGKGGKQRGIPAEARPVIDYVKSQIGKDDVLGWPLTRDGKIPTLEQNLKHYDNLMAKLRFTMNERGVTGHGLRAQFAENFALYKGLVPPSLGGRNDQLPPDELKLRKSWVSEALGHHRPHIVAAYFCAFGREKFHEAEYERTRRHLEQAVEVLDRRGYSPVPSERYDDCVLIREVLTPLRCDVTLRQIHALWAIASQREGLEWQAPKGETVTMLEGAALTLLRLDARQRK